MEITGRCPLLLTALPPTWSLSPGGVELTLTLSSPLSSPQVEFSHEGANRERAEAPSEADGTRARYSCIGSAGGSGDNVLLAGTTNGYVHFLDVATGR